MSLMPSRLPGARTRSIPKAIAGSLAAIAMAAALPAAADAAAIINNGTVQIGVRDLGDLNVNSPGSRSASGTPVTGLRYMPTNYEATAAGCTCEGWGAADAISGSSGFANSASGTGGASLVSFTSTATTATSVVNAGSTLRVTHEYRPAPQTQNLYEVLVTIENISTANVDARYRRVMDWDIEPTPFQEFSTVDIGTATALLRASNNGFMSSNPLAFFGGTPAPFTDLGPRDHGAAFDFGFGQLAPGASKTFKIFYGGAGNETDALTALGAVGAEAYSFGQPNTPDGKTLGTPNTFIFAFRGVGGAPIVKAPDPVYTLELAPATSSKPVGTGHALVATLKDSGAPLDAKNVKFSVAGANTASGTDATDANGKADFSYSGAAVGDDVIEASFDADGDGTPEASATAAATWTDATPPVVTPSVTGTLGDNGWYTSNIEVSWTVVDEESPATTDGCDTVTVSEDTAGRTFTCTATSAGGTTTESVTVKRDATKPTITASRTAANEQGWNNGDVVVEYTCSDELSGVASCSSDETLSGEGAGQSSTGTAVDQAGNTASATVSDINIDLTAPVVVLGGGGTYKVNESVTITCSATDALSGILSSTCSAVAGTKPAYEYALGANTVSAGAVDNADNTGGDSTTVTVTVDADSLCSLTERWVSKAGVAHSLCVKLRNAAAKNDRDKRQAALDNYRNELAAQSGKSITAEHAAILAELSRAL